MAHPSALNNNQEGMDVDTGAADKVFCFKYSPHHDLPIPNVSYDPNVNKIVRITPGGGDLLLFPFFKDKTKNAATASMGSSTSTTLSGGDVITYFKQNRPNEKTIFELREPIPGLDVKLKGARLTVFQHSTSSDTTVEKAMNALLTKL